MDTYDKRERRMIKLKDLLTEVKPGDVYKDSGGDILLIVKPFIRNKWRFVNFNLQNRMVTGHGTTPEKFFEDEKILKLSSSHKNTIKKILKNPEDIDYLEKDGTLKVKDVLKALK